MQALDPSARGLVLRSRRLACHPFPPTDSRIQRNSRMQITVEYLDESTVATLLDRTEIADILEWVVAEFDHR